LRRVPRKRYPLRIETPRWTDAFVSYYIFEPLHDGQTDCVRQVRSVAAIADGRLKFTQFNSCGRARVNLYPSCCGGVHRHYDSKTRSILVRTGSQLPTMRSVLFYPKLGTGPRRHRVRVRKCSVARVWRLFVLNVESSRYIIMSRIRRGGALRRIRMYYCYNHYHRIVPTYIIIND